MTRCSKKEQLVRKKVHRVEIWTTKNSFFLVARCLTERNLEKKTLKWHTVVKLECEASVRVNTTNRGANSDGRYQNLLDSDSLNK